MRRSFRAQLAYRVTLAMAAAMAAACMVGYRALALTLDRQIDASLLSVASLQAAAVTDEPTGRMTLHEWDITPDEASSLRDLNRFVQVWSNTGSSLLRSRHLTTDLPLDRSSLDAAAEGQLAWHEDALNGTPMRSLYYSLLREGPEHEPHVLQVSAPLDARDRALGLVRYFLLGTFALATGGTFLGSWWLARRAIVPVDEIIDQADEIGAGTLGQRISVHADIREYERLVSVLNTMLDRLGSAFETQRRFTADASHELRSPVTALRGELELALRRERSREEYRRVIESAHEETERLSELAANLLTLARADAGGMTPHMVSVDLGARVAGHMKRLEPKASSKDIALSLSTEGPPETTCDPLLMDRLVWNLLDNAVKFTPPGGRVEIRLSTGGGALTFEVADTGPGVAAGREEALFQRFEREDASRGLVEGAGLGLAIVDAIAHAHGGSVSVQNRPTGGARFTVRWPLSAGGSEGRQPVPHRPTRRSRSSSE